MNQNTEYKYAAYSPYDKPGQQHPVGKDMPAVLFYKLQRSGCNIPSGVTKAMHHVLYHKLASKSHKDAVKKEDFYKKLRHTWFPVQNSTLLKTIEY